MTCHFDFSISKLFLLLHLLLTLTESSVTIDLDKQQAISPQAILQMQNVSGIIFQLTPENLTFKIQKMLLFAQCLHSNPAIFTTIQIKNVERYDGSCFESVAVSGTFDHLHLGHQILLLYATLSSSKTIYIRVTDRQMPLKRKKLQQMIQPRHIRVHHIMKFIKSIKEQIQIFQFHNSFANINLQALVVSKETEIGGLKYNQQRKQMGMKQLALIVCPLLSPKQNDISSKISSTNIREYLLQKNNMTLNDYIQQKGYFYDLMRRVNVLNDTKIEILWEEVFTSFSVRQRLQSTILI